MKKTVIFLASIVLALFVSVPVCAKSTRDYNDIAADAWYFEYVKDMSMNELMTGLDKHTFGANQELERGQFATVLYRTVGKPDTSYELRFEDVADGQFYSKPIIWANDVGVVTGYENGLYGVSDKITREQFATMLYRYSQQQGWDTTVMGDVSSFPDGNQVSGFAAEAMQWAVGTGIISGNADGTLAPQGYVSRAVCATMISRFKNNTVTGVSGTLYNSFSDRTLWETTNENSKYEVSVNNIYTNEACNATIQNGEFRFDGLIPGIYQIIVVSNDPADRGTPPLCSGTLFVPMQKEFAFHSYIKNEGDIRINVYDNAINKNSVGELGLSFNNTSRNDSVMYHEEGYYTTYGRGIGDMTYINVYDPNLGELLYEGYVFIPDTENPEIDIYID